MNGAYRNAQRKEERKAVRLNPSPSTVGTYRHTSNSATALLAPGPITKSPPKDLFN